MSYLRPFKLLIMKKRSFLILSLGFLCSYFQTNAQLLNKIVDHAADKVNEKIDHAIDRAGEQPTTDSQVQPTSTNETRPHVRQSSNVDDFVAGSNVIFKDNFQEDSLRTFPHQWKTNGSGSVATVSGVPGKWFMLKSDATFKIDSLLRMPESFTVEFDVLALCDKVDDFSPLIFGFDNDNSVGSYESDGSAKVSLLYFNDDEYTAFSSELDKYYSGDFDLRNVVNRPMHVALQVKGAHLIAYLEKTKILDADMFLPNVQKYFFISAPLNYKHGAQMLIGNVRIAE